MTYYFDLTKRKSSNACEIRVQADPEEAYDTTFVLTKFLFAVDVIFTVNHFLESFLNTELVVSMIYQNQIRK